MTATQKRKSAPTRRHIELRVRNDTTPEEERRQKQNALISTEIQNLHVIAGAIPDSLKESSFDTVDMVQELRARAKAVQSGDLSQIEAMLITQATTLEGLFSKLARMAMSQNHLPNIEGLLRPALKAQQQCTNTLKVLAEIKQPRQVAFVKQANIANNQQVNNGSTPMAHTLTHAHEENPKQSNELLEVIPHERMDTGAPSTASRTDTAMATLEEIDRAKD
jgi:hypothetical protein